MPNWRAIGRKQAACRVRHGRQKDWSPEVVVRKLSPEGMRFWRVNGKLPPYETPTMWVGA
jgi:hypothetical protein